MAAQSPHPLGTAQIHFLRWGNLDSAKEYFPHLFSGTGDLPPNIAQYTPPSQLPISETSIICRLKRLYFIGLNDHLAFIRKSVVVH
jgi:hypothetical protein